MTQGARVTGCLLAVLVAAASIGCQLPRPRTTAVRALEPELVTPPPTSGTSAEAIPIRLLQTESRGHIARRLIRQRPEGELTEDPVWRWANSPHGYLDTALRMALSSTPGVRLVDAAAATELSVTLLAWHLAGSETQPVLVGTVEVIVVDRDRVVRTHVNTDREPISTDLPRTLAAASGRLLQRLAAASVAFATTAR
ncbi:hypothetical protein TBR22_A42240 [Luteitalea sp. TBR-22]|uniref:hypothetical protein n=1 Tax=Luteitalea sp. TBR-22 TaxID=2802971 RepID=UPI001AF6273A|nr:hypothetical protein [Luteitalea sp. TBR-22]BCS34998.1 hypothetical protein TBR22_A42240 [Luteitalea sp. TBR-22]